MREAETVRANAVAESGATISRGHGLLAGMAAFVGGDLLGAAFYIACLNSHQADCVASETTRELTALTM